MGDRKIILGTLLFIVDNGKVLLIKREKHPYIGYWGLTGGKIDFGEHPEETALREAKEETGLDIEFVKVRGVLSEVINENGGKADHFVLFICELKPKSTEFVESAEGELKWFDISEIENIKIIPSEVAIIKEIASQDNYVDIHKSHIMKKDEEYFLELFSK